MPEELPASASTCFPSQVSPGSKLNWNFIDAGSFSYQLNAVFTAANWTLRRHRSHLDEPLSIFLLLKGHALTAPLLLLDMCHLFDRITSDLHFIGPFRLSCSLL